jgi:hypothetical protein
VDILAHLKGNDGATQVGIIGLGGIVGDQAQVTYPAVELNSYSEYILCLLEDNTEVDNEAIRALHPNLKQVQLYAGPQGAITKQFGLYRQAHFEKMIEEQILDSIKAITGEPATTPGGELFVARPFVGLGGQRAITSFSPSPTNAGTIVTSDFLTISGSGFGSTAGTVFYTNSDDGGATFTASGVATDNVSWTDTQIENKVARRAGTGVINVNGTFTSSSSLTVNYAHLDINSSFSGFGSTTRQRYYLVDENASGGYSFVYSSNFYPTAAAMDAYEDMLCVWQDGVSTNLEGNDSTTTTTAALDGESVVLFSALPAGVLGRMTSRFSGSATGSCNMANTVWWTTEMDCEFHTDPPVTGYSWNYGPGASTSSQYDFRSVALHEIGHGIGLGHVIASGDVMHYALTNGTDIRTLSTNNIVGGAAKFAYSSTAFCFNPTGVDGPMIAGDYCTLLPLEWITVAGEAIDRSTNVISWHVPDAHADAHYEVQKQAAQAAAFQAIGAVEASPLDRDGRSYSWTDESGSGINYYRIKAVSWDGSTLYSPVIRIENIEDQIHVTFDMDARELHIHALATDDPNRLLITNAAGQVILDRQQLGFPATVNLTTLPAGVYIYNLSVGHRVHRGHFVVP